MPEPKVDVTPRFAFLGFCERAKVITEGHPALWGWSLLGMSSSRVFHVFPVNLRSITIAIAIYAPLTGEEFKLVFRNTNGEASFDLAFKISSFTKSGIPDGKTFETFEYTTGKPLEGWTFLASSIDSDIVVYSAGTYDIFLVCDDVEQFIGQAVFSHSASLPFTPEEITAIRSDPMATKFVKMDVKCNACAGNLRVYAGLEKSEKLEQEGYLWSQGIQESSYACECGKSSFSLIPIRTGLHGILRRSLDPDTASTFSPVRLYEKRALEEACREFLRLMNAKTPEEELQKFLELNPLFFNHLQPKRINFKPPILTKFVADFAVLNARSELILIEIEKPHMRLVKKDGGMTAELQHAFHQVRTWMQVMNDHRAAALEALDLKLTDVAKIRGIVIAGRTPSDEKKTRLLRTVATPEIELFTYDDILHVGSELIKRIATI